MPCNVYADDFLQKVSEGLRFLSGYLFLQDEIKVSEIAIISKSVCQLLSADDLFCLRIKSFEALKFLSAYLLCKIEFKKNN